MSDIQETLLPVFIEETELALGQIFAFMQAYNHGIASMEALEEARRAAHTIKGTAGLVKRFQSSAVAKELEHYLDACEADGKAELDKISAWYDELCRLLDMAKSGMDEEQYLEQDDVSSEEALEALIDVTGQDLINDFALPFMMKLHQAGAELQELVRPACCRFFVSGRQYFIRIDEVSEIFQYEAITPLPYAPAYIIGLLNIRGNVVPIVDLARVDGESRGGNVATSYAVVAIQGDDYVAFVSDSMPNLSLKTAGHHIAVEAFIEHNRVRV